MTQAATVVPRTPSTGVIASIEAAHRCARDLAERGYIVLSAHCTGRNPIVWIAPPPTMDFPKACLVVRRRPPSIRERIMVALHQGVQVHWTAREH